MRLFILWICVCAKVLPAMDRAFVYTENIYRSQDRLATSSLKVDWSRTFLGALGGFAQVGQELASDASPKALLLDPTNSFAYVTPGLRWTAGHLTLSLEGRFRKFYAAVDSPYFDGRGLVVYNDFFPLTLGGGVSAFLEPYSESLLTSADQMNVVLTNFVRGGFRAAVRPDTYADIFLEPYVVWDRLGHDYYRKGELRPSVRLQYAPANFSLGIIASYVVARGARGLLFLSAEL